jgi:hypothetical protein
MWPTMRGGQVIEVANFTVCTVIYIGRIIKFNNTLIINNQYEHDILNCD